MFSSTSPRYQPVSQLDNDSDGEVVLYAHHRAVERFGNGVYDGSLDLELPPSKPGRISKPGYSRLHAVCFVFAFLVVLCIVLALALLVVVMGKFLLAASTITPTQTSSISVVLTPSPLPTASPTEAETDIPTSSVSWERVFEGFSTEASLQLRDLNGDGILDVVAVLSDMRCASSVTVLDGVTGETIWEREMHFEAFAVRCDLDVNEDGSEDCIVCGRDGGFLAVDGRDGNLLWVVQPTNVFPLYNFYFPLIVRDLDGDGVRDLINGHGGDIRYMPTQHDRSPGFLLVVSGRTGQQLMDAMLTPDGHEMYMSPVLFTVDGTTEVILLGSGGETVPGSLWAVTLDSIQRKVSQYKAISTYHKTLDNSRHKCTTDDGIDLEDLRPAFNWTLFQPGRATHVVCPSMAGLTTVPNSYRLCVYQVLAGEEKGVIVPPVVADVTGDGVDDLVVSLFEGHTRLLDGRDLSVVWDYFVPNTESNSIPAPLYFNEDDTLDILVRTSKGAWPEYTASDVFVLDGRNAEKLWHFPASKSGMMSPVTIAADTHGYDVMVFVGISTFIHPNKESAPLSMRSRHHGDDNDSTGKMLTPDFEDSADPLAPDSADPLAPDSDGLLAPDSDGLLAPDSDGLLAPDSADTSDLWQATADDVFPDPVSNFNDFLDYCLEIIDIPSASLFALDRRMASLSPLRPLLTNDLYIHLPEMVSSGSKPHETEGRDKRHGQQTAPDVERVLDSHRMRCLHLAVSDMIVSTPVLGDINADGKLELAYAVVWEGVDFKAFHGAPPKMVIKTLTIEDAMKEVYGEESLNFSKLLPASKQPWSRYMGSAGDNVYHSQL